MKGRIKQRLKLFFRLAATFLFCLFLFPADTHSSQAQDEDYKKQLNQNVLEQLDELDLKALDDYLASLEGYDGKGAKERILEYVNGGGTGIAGFANELLGVLFGNVKKVLPSFACIAAIALLCGVINSLQSRFLGESTGTVVFFIAYLGALIPVLSVLAECIFSARDATQSMKQQMEIVFPIMLTLMAASGGSVTVAIYKPTVAFLCNGLVGIISDVVFPLTVAIIVFSMVSRFLGTLKMDKFPAFFKSTNKWIMGAGVSIFGMFFTVQGITAASYDGIARRAAKYAIGTGVPIVGGFLSGGFDLAVAGSILIKNSLGNFSLFLLACVLFEPITLLLATNLLLRLTAAITQPFGESKISSFLSDTADNLNYCTAGLLFTAFMYFIVVLLLVCSTEMFI